MVWLLASLLLFHGIHSITFEGFFSFQFYSKSDYENMIQGDFSSENGTDSADCHRNEELYSPIILESLGDLGENIWVFSIKIH